MYWSLIAWARGSVKERSLAIVGTSLARHTRKQVTYPAVLWNPIGVGDVGEPPQNGQIVLMKLRVTSPTSIPWSDRKEEAAKGLLEVPEIIFCLETRRAEPDPLPVVCALVAARLGPCLNSPAQRLHLVVFCVVTAKGNA